MVKVSIIVPVYNATNFLDRCINSLINQTLNEIEIILIDDFSKDESPLLIKEIAEKYPDKIKCIFLNENRKQGYVRNLGIQEAQGEYIAFVDSDDYIDKQMCELAYNKAKEKDYDIVCFDWIDVYPNKSIKRFLSYDSTITGQICNTNRHKILTSKGYFFTRIYKRDFLLLNNIRFAEKIFYEDSPFNFLSLLLAHKIAKIDRNLYFYVQTEGSTSNCRNNERLYDRINATEYLLELTHSNNLYSKFQSYINEKYIKMTVGNIHLCLEAFDNPDYLRLQQISRNLNKNFSQYNLLEEYKKLDKVSKFYLKLNDFSPNCLIYIDRIYKKIIENLK